MDDLKNTIDTFNEMIRSLRHTNPQNVEGDWLKTDKERFTRLLQGQRDVPEAAAEADSCQTNCPSQSLF